jgi:hypothetical protein
MTAKNKAAVLAADSTRAVFEGACVTAKKRWRVALPPRDATPVRASLKIVLV